MRTAILSSPILLAVGISCTLGAAALAAAGQATSPKPGSMAGAPVDFSRDIRPVLSGRCYACHGPDEESRAAGLRLDLRTEATKKRPIGPAVVPGNPAASRLYVRVTAANPAQRMPPPKSGHPLTPSEVELLRRWIAQGASYSGHWAFEKPVLPAPPKVKKSSAWVRNPVDAFVLQRLEKAGLTPAPEADRYTLIRRVSLDLIGLPPTPEEVDAFVRECEEWERDRKGIQVSGSSGMGSGTPGSQVRTSGTPRKPNTRIPEYLNTQSPYEKLVDRLLSSPHFGERWARMWLDLARYADSAGYGSDPLRLNIWPYRDWVIEAFNRNMPYDQFTVEQIAGDLLPNPTTSQLVATAFHRNTMTNTEGGTDDEEFRVAAVKDRIATTSQVWMGLTMGCAQCHTHKFDPITQKEYYQFFALFNQTEDADRPDEQPTLPLPTEAEKAKTARLQAEVKELEIKLAAAPAPEQDALKKALEAKKKELAAVKPVDVPILRELPAEKQRASHFLIKGNFLNPGDKVQPALPAAFNPLPKEAPLNRLGVARWLVSPENPLTARVAVNRFWSQLFGTGIVETEEDFGTQGSLPTHPELLDYLAISFMNGRSLPHTPTPPHPHTASKPWDIKALLRLIVTSATYRQSSRVSSEALARDPRNQLLSHYPRRRLDAEGVRDQALALSGLLSRKIGGPSVYPPQPEGLWRAAFNGQRTWSTSTGEDRYRRGLYTFWRRTVPYPSMATFDAPSRENCTLRRIPTNTPLQALVTLNDPVYVELSQALGRRIVREGGSTVPERMRFALRLVLSRPEQSQQVAALVTLYDRELTYFRAHPQEAKKLATQPLGALPPDLDAAQAAAWTVVGNVLLNLDGVLAKG